MAGPHLHHLLQTQALLFWLQTVLNMPLLSSGLFPGSTQGLSLGGQDGTLDSSVSTITDSVLFGRATNPATLYADSVSEHKAVLKIGQGSSAAVGYNQRRDHPAPDVVWLNTFKIVQDDSAVP
jgi:hypothetical protein